MSDGIRAEELLVPVREREQTGTQVTELIFKARMPILSQDCRLLGCLRNIHCMHCMTGLVTSPTAAPYCQRAFSAGVLLLCHDCGGLVRLLEPGVQHPAAVVGAAAESGAPHGRGHHYRPGGGSQQGTPEAPGAVLTPHTSFPLLPGLLSSSPSPSLPHRPYWATQAAPACTPLAYITCTCTRVGTAYLSRLPHPAVRSDTLRRSVSKTTSCLWLPGQLASRERQPRGSFMRHVHCANQHCADRERRLG